MKITMKKLKKVGRLISAPSQSVLLFNPWSVNPTK